MERRKSRQKTVLFGNSPHFALKASMPTFHRFPRTQMRGPGQEQATILFTADRASAKIRKSSDSVKHVLHGEEEANARRATHAIPRPVGEACQFRSGFSSVITQKTTLSEKGFSRKKTAVGRKTDCGNFRHSED